MKIYEVIFIWSTEENDDLETHYYYSFEDALKKFNGILADETSDDYWAAAAIDENGNVTDESNYELLNNNDVICDETVKREVVELWMGDSPERLVGKTYVHYTDKFMIEQMNKVNFIIPKE